MKKRLRAIFTNTIFWDVEEIDMDKHASFIIKRVLEYGNEHDIKVLKGIYSDNKIINVIKNKRGLSPRTRRFWMVYFNIKPEEITCLKM